MACYFPLTAEDFARRRRRRFRKLETRPELRGHIIERLRAGWSPQQIAGRSGNRRIGAGQCAMRRFTATSMAPWAVSHALYRCPANGHRRRGRRFGRKPRSSPIPMTHWIANRPAEVDSRRTFGHWECDLVVFPKAHGKANVTSLLERKSRYIILLPNADRRSRDVIGRIGKAFGALPPPVRRTITFDRGTEFMGYPALASQLSVASYFCDPHSPWQKGAVENSNGRVRRYLPPEAPQAALALEALRDLACRLNDTPRRCLGYRTPCEVFHDHVAQSSGTECPR